MERTLEKIVGGSRAAVLRSLEGGLRSVGDIVTDTGLSQPNVSNHLARLRDLGLVRAQRQGRRVYYQIVSPELVRALLSAPPQRKLSDEERQSILDEAYPTFEAAVLAGDHETARTVVDRSLAAGLPWQDTYTSLFTVVMSRIGDRWASGALTVAQEHAATALIGRLISHVATLRVPARKPGHAQVVIACVEGERHDIGAHMAADFLAADGLNVSLLGADVPIDDLLEYVRDTGARILCLSAATPEREPAVREVASRLPDYCPNGTCPDLVLAGRLVQQKPDLARELGVRVAPDDLSALSEMIREAIG